MTILVSCSKHIGVEYAPDTARSARKTLSNYLDYERRPIDVVNHDLEPVGHYDVRHLEYDSVGENAQPDDRVSGFYYRSRTPGKKPLVVVLPIWGSSTYPSRMIGKMVRNQSEGGANVFVMHGKERIFDWKRIAASKSREAFDDVTADTAKRLQTTSIDVRRLLDWAETQPDIDTERIGLVGFSIGAIVAGVVAPHEPRVASTVLVMGGGRPGHVLAYCDGRSQKSREAVTKRFGWSVDEYRERWSAALDDLDPVKYAAAMDPGRVLIVDAEQDECIPRAAQNDLWEALGRPQRISLPYGHKVAFLAMTPLGGNLMREEIWEFLDRSLMAPDR